MLQPCRAVGAHRGFDIRRREVTAALTSHSDEQVDKATMIGCSPESFLDGCIVKYDLAKLLEIFPRHCALLDPPARPDGGTVIVPSSGSS